VSRPDLRRAAFLVILASALCASGASAQVSYTSMPLDSGFGRLDTAAPPIPAQQIITEFAAKESIFRKALDNYTYQRSVRVQTLDDDNKPDGEYYEVADIIFDSTGRRTERVMMSPADFQDIEERLPFVLTTEDIGQYDLTWVGSQKVDEVDCYVFDVRPKVIEKKKRYFQGRIWVDQKELQIVVTNGKNVPDDLRKGHEDLSIPFVTFRQQIDGKYWFPVYTHGDGVLHFSAGSGYVSQNVHLRETLKYTNYIQFHSTIRILRDGQEIDNSNTSPPQTPPGQTPPAQPPPHP
jgi:hypothetical protein